MLASDGAPDEPESTSPRDETLSKRWLERYKEYRKFVQERGRLPQATQADPTEAQLASWRLNTGRDHRLGRLRTKQEFLLEQIPGWTWPEREASNMQVRDQAFVALESYVAHTGTSLMRTGLRWAGEDIAAATANWRTTRGSRGLSPEFVARLEALPDWNWASTAETVALRSRKVLNNQQLLDLVCTRRELDAYCANARTSWLDGTLDPDEADELERTPNWDWLPLPDDQGEDAFARSSKHPLVRSGIEMLRVEAGFMGGASAKLNRALQCADAYQAGSTLQGIGTTVGLSRERVRQIVEELCTQAQTPMILRYSNTFWRSIWRPNYRLLRSEGLLTWGDVGEVLSCLRRGTTSPHWPSLKSKRPLLAHIILGHIAGSREPFTPDPSSGRHILDIPEVAAYLHLLLRSNILYESQLKALPDNHPAHGAVIEMRNALVEPAAGSVPSTLAIGAAATKIADTSLSRRAKNALIRRGVTTVHELTSLSAEEVAALQHVGDTTIADIRQYLARVGLCLRGDPPPSTSGV